MNPEKLQKEYRAQLQGQMFITGCEWVDIMAYHPQIKPVVHRVYRDDGYIGKLEEALRDFRKRMNEKCQILIDSGYLVIEDTYDQPLDTYMAG